MAKKILPKGYKKKPEPEEVLASTSDVEEVAEGTEPVAAPTVFEQKTVAMEVAPEVLVAATPTVEVEVVSNAPDLRALDADISAFEDLDLVVRGGADGAVRFAKHLADIDRAVTEASVSAADAEVLKNTVVRSRQLAFVSKELDLPGLIYNADAVSDALASDNAELEELKARALDILQTGVDCGLHLEQEVRRHLDQLVQKIDAELAKPERAKPAKQPCAGPEQWKPSTTELNQAVDTLGVDPGAATVAEPSVPPPAEEAPIPLVVQKDDGSEEWQTGAHEAAPTGAFVSPSRETEELRTAVIRTPLPPRGELPAGLIDPFEAVVAQASARADQLLAATPPIPPAGPAHPEPEPQADPALAHTEAVPITPAKGVPVTAPLGGQIGQTMVGNPTGSQPAVAPVEPPPPATPPPDQNDGLDEVAKLVTVYLAAPVTERMKGDHPQNYISLCLILDMEGKSEKPAVKRRAQELRTLLETAYQVSKFAQQVDGIDLTATPMSVAGLAALPEPLLKGRIERAIEFTRNRDADPLTADVGKLVYIFLGLCEEALVLKHNAHPTPDPAKPHGPGSRPAMPAPAPNLTPAATPQAKAAAAAPTPKSEAPTGIAPAVTPPAPAAPLPTPVISTPSAFPSGVELSPSIAPPAPTASPFSALVGGAAVRPGMHVGSHESTEAKAAREAAERRQQEVQRLQRRAKVKQIAYWVVGTLASIFLAVTVIVGSLIVYRRLNNIEDMVARLSGQKPEISTAMQEAAEQRVRTIVADAAAAAARQEQHASTRNGGLRCSPAGQRSECSNLPPDTHQSPTGPGYYCPENAPMEPMGSGGYNACHCQWCQ